jgi:hypothetical protein
MFLKSFSLAMPCWMRSALVRHVYREFFLPISFFFFDIFHIYYRPLHSHLLFHIKKWGCFLGLSLLHEVPPRTSPYERSNIESTPKKSRRSAASQRAIYNLRANFASMSNYRNSGNTRLTAERSASSCLVQNSLKIFERDISWSIIYWHKIFIWAVLQFLFFYIFSTLHCSITLLKRDSDSLSGDLRADRDHRILSAGRFVSISFFLSKFVGFIRGF